MDLGTLEKLETVFRRKATALMASSFKKMKCNELSEWLNVLMVYKHFYDGYPAEQ